MIARTACLLAVVSLGCDDEPSCSRDEDCGAFQRCIERECRPLPRSDASVRDAGLRDGGRADTGFDAGAPVDCMSPADCPAGYACVDSTCVCGEPETPCCPMGPRCAPGAACNAFGNCEGCGDVGQPCCDGACSMLNAVCDSAANVCTSCGGEAELCCAMSTCDGDALCVTGRCQTGCGQAGEPCCSMMRCAMGLVCMGSSCRM